ncbi:hypothetical protein NKR23_g9864 [Pleurostoma richardsiae]|uniref:SUR7 protein n=1 Tax=Pleurostoma richardsiae TaxID=41990 RepID=A0AA38RLY3_9PEZI|nr:hypothetical protein NKR23_g9864 [Pleurostoma richardsiae]
MRFLTAVPIVLSAVSFVLAMLALLAGKDEGFMEEYHIITFNTSEFGHILVPTSTSGGSQATTTTGGDGGIGGFFSSLVASATAAVGAAESHLASIEGDIADELAGELGIKQFYSLHVLDVCEGDFKPNATAPHAGYNVTNCTKPLDTSYMNVSALLDRELRLGPLHLNITDLGFTQDLQDEIDKLPALFRALAALFIISAALTGLALLASLAAFFLLRPVHPQNRGGTAILLTNFTIALLAALFLLAGGLGTTIGGKKAVNEVNDKGSDIGITAERGNKFIAMIWAAFALIALCVPYWAAEMVLQMRVRKRLGGARPYGKGENGRW